jgi:hypothetical protein
MTITESATQARPDPHANPARLVADCVDRFLGLARTWLAWDGRPLVSEDGDRVYTPNKAVRRHAGPVTPTGRCARSRSTWRSPGTRSRSATCR